MMQIYFKQGIMQYKVPNDFSILYIINIKTLNKYYILVILTICLL